MQFPQLTVRSVRSRAVNAPINLPLATSRGTIDIVPLVLVDLETEEGVTGCGYVFCYLDLAAPFVCLVLSRIEELVRGQAVDPKTLYPSLRDHFTLIGTEGSLCMAISAFDVACWDALAKAANLPLSRLLGAKKDTVPAYNSKGLSLKEPDALAAEARDFLAEGFTSIKLRLGRDKAEEDLLAIEAVRNAVPKDTVLMVDYNQALKPEEMIARLPQLEKFDLAWIEEPVRHDDYIGNARVREATDIPVQIGENFNGTDAMVAAIHAEACDFIMPDLCRIGGVTGWLKAAEIALSADMRMSSHLYPEVSAHLLAATPTCHLLEYVDWAEPILKNPLRIENGRAVIPDTPGVGLDWDEEAVAHFRIN